MAQIKKLKNGDTTIYPITSTSAVYDSQGKSLETKLPNITKNPNATNGDIISTHLTVGTRNSDGTIGSFSFTSGYNNTASGGFSSVIGGHDNKVSSDDSAILGGGSNTASGSRSIVVGGDTNRASGLDSAVIGGIENTASIDYSAVVGGGYNTASGYNSSVVGGSNSIASIDCSAVVGGSGNTASGHYSAVVGGSENTTSMGDSVVIGGNNNIASGGCSAVVGGNNNTALSYQTKTGHYSKEGTAGADEGTTGDAFIIGNGTSSATSNAFRVTYAGGVYGKAAYNSTGADYAEMFEWADGNPNNEDRRGLFAYIENDKMRLATANDTDKHRLGIISARPAVVGDNFDDDWHGKYLTDIFGAVLTQVVHHEAEYRDVEVTDHKTGETHIKKVCIHEECDCEEPILNPNYNPEQKYVPRAQRPEYDFWSFIGKLVVTDDGTCKAGSYCYPYINGVATACEDAEKGFYVMERLDETHIRVLVK